MPEITDSDRAMVATLRASVLRLSRRLRNQRADESLTATEISVLGTLARCGPASPGELARREHVQPPSMTRIIAMLEAKNLVRRDPHPQDRRQVVVSRTEHAERIVDESRRRRDAWIAEHLGGLDAEEVELLRRAVPVLEKLSDL